MIQNIVPRHLQGKTAKSGKTPYEVLAFYSMVDWDASEDEKHIKKFIVAKFGCYGDATLYAHQLDNSTNPPKIILIRV